MVFDQKIITHSPQETAALGQALANSLITESDKEGSQRCPRIVCLYGPLGAGKTTLTQGFAKALGLTARLLSPTFIIVRRYSIPKRDRFFYHIDLYRVETERALSELGIDEIFANPAAAIVVEWAEKLGERLPEKRIDVHLGLEDSGAHSVEVRSHGQ